jgi:hypothetical protein
MDVRQARESLLQAVNARDIEAVRSFVAESYVGRNELGLVLADYRGVMDYAARLFQKHPEYRKTLEVEAVEKRVGRPGCRPAGPSHARACSES